MAIMYCMPKLYFVLSSHIVVNSQEFDKPGSSRFKSSDLSKAQQRRYLLYAIFLLEAGPEGKDNVSGSGQYRFFRRHKSIISAL